MGTEMILNQCSVIDNWLMKEQHKNEILAALIIDILAEFSERRSSASNIIRFSVVSTQ